jgi:hypothetical protein
MTPHSQHLMGGVPVPKPGGMHQSEGPASLPSLPAIPDGDPQAVVLQLLKGPNPTFMSWAAK